MLIAHDSWHSQVIHLPKPYSSTCESMVGKGWKRMRKGETDEETSTLAELWHASTLRIKMNQEGASGTGKCTVQCTTVDGQKNQTLQTSTSKTPHPKFQCWKKLYLTASVFRVWFFLLTGAKRAAQRQHWNLGVRGLTTIQQGFYFIVHLR